MSDGSAAYSAVHNRLMRARGKARHRRCENCGGAAIDWAYDGQDPEAKRDEQGRVYSDDLQHYVALCRRCHRNMDAATHCRRGHRYNEANTYLYKGRRFCRMCRRDYQRKRRS